MTDSIRAPNPRWRQLFGAAVEDLAARHLQRHGCTVLARRFRALSGEVDIIIRDGDVIAFVEVKARHSAAFGAPEEAIGRRKRRRIRRVAQVFLMRRCLAGAPCRFDVVSVRVSAGKARIRWLRDAF